MMTTHVTALDRTMQQTHDWVTGVAGRMGSDDPEKGYVALRAVLHTLRDRLLPGEAVDLSAQLPTLVRGIYFEGWKPSDKPMDYRHKEDFLGRVRADAPTLQNGESEQAVTAVFATLSAEIDRGQVDHVFRAMPEAVRALWPATGR